MSMLLAYDPGYGNIKLFGPQGSLVMQSAVSAGGREQVGRMAGLRTAKRPLCIETASGVFHVGPNAHDWGRPIENLDLDRLTGTPEMLALFYGALSQYRPSQAPVSLFVGLPIHALMGPEGQSTQQAVRNALRRTHTWLADGQEHTVQIASVRLTSQPVGAMFDYLLDDEGQMYAARQSAFRGEMGILGIGMNTLDLLVVRGGAPVQRFTAGETLGVRRLLELAGRDGSLSLAERDLLLRSGRLPVADMVTVWQSEVLGFIESQWGEAFRRFDAIIATGGGSLLLQERLTRRFKEKLHVSDDPIIATARGLHKYGLMSAQRGKRG
jgi:hypothetical protein